MDEKWTKSNKIATLINFVLFVRSKRHRLKVWIYIAVNKNGLKSFEKNTVQCKKMSHAAPTSIKFDVYAERDISLE